MLGHDAAKLGTLREMLFGPAKAEFCQVVCSTAPLTRLKKHQQQMQHQKTVEAETTKKLLQQEDLKLTEMREHFAKEVSQQVWNRLNTYIQEYGKEHNHKIILGTQGDGNIMYADDFNDVTSQLVTYVNSKYEGN